MRRPLIREMLQAAAMACVGLASTSVLGQDYPSRPLSIYVGTAAGSGADLLVRFFAEKLRLSLGQPVLVENRAGALGNIAAAAVAKAKPDGHTLLIAPNITYAVSMYMFKHLPFDPVKDLLPVGTLAQMPFVLVVDPQRSSAGSVPDLTALLKSKGDKSSFGAPTGISLAAAEMYKPLVGVDSLQVPYKTMQQALLGLTGGDIDFLFADATTVLAQVRAGRYRALAVTTEQRSQNAPNVPTMVESGVTGFQPVPAWFAVALPAATPVAIADTLNALFNQILAREETTSFLRNIGADPFPGSRRDMALFQAREIESWAKLAKLAKIEPQ